MRASAPPRGPRPAGHPVTVGPPTGERGKRHGSRWSAPPDERPWPVALGLLGLPLADGDGMGRLLPQPPDNLDQASTSILEPEVPAGGIEFSLSAVEIADIGRVCVRRLEGPLLAGLATAVSVYASSFHGLTLDFASIVAGSLAVIAGYAALPSLKGGFSVNRVTHVSLNHLLRFVEVV